MTKPPLNPFPLPGWSRTPMRPLCPWKNSRHRDFYVRVDDGDFQYDDFAQQMGDLSALLAEGRLVLVTGESGCGKTALVHRCADWVVREVDRRRDAGELGPAARGLVLDLTGCLPDGPARSIEDRAAHVCDELFGRLVDNEALRPQAIAQLAPDRDTPRRIYPRLAAALAEDLVLVVLLPTPGELAAEVVQYARAFAGPKVLFMAESDLLDPEEVADVVRQLEAWVPPITLHVGALEDGDVRRFVEDRLQRHSTVGTYPRMSDEAVDFLGGWAKSVAQLQRTLHGTYEHRLGRGLSFGEEDVVTVDDILAFFNNGSRNGLGKQR
ncbi:AAA family ATPase [Umezawaea sp. NPDC059074]|uniref:AAA family ATPase n=1 Tax=Umezawaea sp. NPDC059074 TaxID=3346716 RepID=UPI0036837F75